MRFRNSHQATKNHYVGVGADERKPVFPRKKAIVSAAIVGALLFGVAAITTTNAAFGGETDPKTSVKGLWHSVDLDAQTRDAWDARALKDLTGEGGRFQKLDLERNPEAQSQLRVKDDRSYAAVLVYVRSTKLGQPDSDKSLAESRGSSILTVQPFNRYSTVTVIYSVPKNKDFTTLSPTESSVKKYGDQATLFTDNIDQDGVPDSTGTVRFDYVDGTFAGWDSLPEDGPWNDNKDCSSAPYLAQLAREARARECELAQSRPILEATNPSTVVPINPNVSCMAAVVGLSIWDQVVPQMCLNSLAS